MPTGAILCNLLTNTPANTFKWSRAEAGPFLTPAYNGSMLGGSANGWLLSQIIPGETRNSISAWGTPNGPNKGGCCSQVYSGNAGFGLPYVMHLQNMVCPNPDLCFLNSPCLNGGTC